MPDPMIRVFISHSPADSRFARGLSHALQHKGYATWLAEKDQALAEDFSSGLHEALRTSDWFVLLLSDHSLRSPLMFFELGAALEQGARVFPVALSTPVPTDVTRQLRDVRVLPAEDLRPDDVAEQVAAAIREAA